MVTSVKQPAGCRRIDDPGRRDTQRRQREKEEENEEEEEEEEEEAATEEALDGKGAVGQVKWRVPAGFYAALATGPPCHYLSLSPFLLFLPPNFLLPAQRVRLNLVFANRFQ